MVRNTNAS